MRLNSCNIFFFQYNVITFCFQYNVITFCFYYNVILDIDDHSCSFLYLLDIGFALTHSIFYISRYFPKRQPELLCFYTC